MATELDRVRADKSKAKKFWESLSNEEKWSIGDDLVLGQVDWQGDWGFYEKPSSAFVREIDYLRMLDE